jgi:UPF0755 protein
LARERGSNGSGERTEAERERAREERERRRAERAGASHSTALEPPLPPPLSEPEHVEPEHVEPEHVEPEHVEPEHVEPEHVEPEHVEPEQVEQVEPEPVEPERAGSVALKVDEYAPTGPEPFEPEHVRAETEPFEPEEARPEPVRTARPPATLPPGLAAPSHRAHIHAPHLHLPHARRPRGTMARAGALLGLLIVLAALAVGGVLIFHHKERPKIIPLPKIVKVVIPEGFTRAQIAVLAHEDGLRGSYLTPSKHSREIDLAHYGAPSDTPNLEGFLFPATYEMYVGAPASQLISEQLGAFRGNFGPGDVDRAKRLGITPYQLLIVASIIEREAAIAHDRPLVAAVIYNRLHLNMTLGIDSTLRYALRDFTTPLTETQLHSASPYNTRTHTGLPPTPISNPGAAAIAAAAHPAHVSYLYYVAGADGCGEQVFSTSYAQFEKNAAAYREAIAKNGGHVPSCKKK